MNDPGSIIRQINIATITDTHHPIIDWFNDLWSLIHKVEVDVFHENGNEFIYYINDHVADRKIAIFYLGRQLKDCDDIFLSCSKDNYWNVLWHKLNMEIPYTPDYEYYLVNEVTQILIEHVKEDILTNRIFGPYTLDSICDVNIKKALNQL